MSGIDEGIKEALRDFWKGRKAVDARVGYAGKLSSVRNRSEVK